MKIFLVKMTRLTCGTGRGNGYVLIPKGHPLHGRHYDEIGVDVHRGLTYSEEVDQDMVDDGRWGLEKEDIGGWLVGFDTAHLGDDMNNRPREAVKKETERLKEQLESYKD